MEGHVLRLPPVLDLRAAEPLWAELRAARGQAIRIDAAEVERFGGLCAQALLAAHAQWAADGLAFAIENPSPAFVETAQLMGARKLTQMEHAA